LLDENREELGVEDTTLLVLGDGDEATGAGAGARGRRLKILKASGLGSVSGRLSIEGDFTGCGAGGCRKLCAPLGLGVDLGDMLRPGDVELGRCLIVGTFNTGRFLTELKACLDSPATIDD
jgi:hypothetical protein